MAGDALGRGATLVEFREPAIVHRAAVQHERLEHDDAGARQGAPGIIEQGRVLGLVVLDSARAAAAQLEPEFAPPAPQAHPAHPPAPTTPGPPGRATPSPPPPLP